MGRAIVRHPQVYLMDEPLSNLDAKLRVQTRAELVELQQRLAVTTVYVTHDQVEAMTMGHRVAVLRDGDLQQCDTPSTLYHEPANLFVAGFIGSPAMNMLPVVGEWAAADRRAPRSASPTTSAASARRSAFDRRRSSSATGPIAGRIRIVEDLGSEAFVHLRDRSRGRRASNRREGGCAVRRLAPATTCAWGCTARVHLFDTAEVRRKSVTL